MSSNSPITLKRDQWIGRLLRSGVIISSLLLLAGLVIGLTSGDSVPSKSSAIGKESALESVSPGSIVAGLSSGNATAFLQLGLLVLILTPVARVGLTVWFFWFEREYLFTFFAGTVFIILVLGLIGVGAL